MGFGALVGVPPAFATLNIDFSAVAKTIPPSSNGAYVIQHRIAGESEWTEIGSTEPERGSIKRVV